MCRLFGSRTRAPSAVSHELFHGANALRVQSREHPDGWGLGWYENGAPRVVRSLTPAHGDSDFEKLSQFVSAQTVLAHVRKASVGRVAQENTHPFQRGRWLFAHNGTLPLWEACRPRIESLIDPSLRESLHGETDSERCFLVFLSRLRKRCPIDAADATSAAAALGETVALVRECVRPADRPAAPRAPCRPIRTPSPPALSADRRNQEKRARPGRSSGRDRGAAAPRARRGRD